MNNQINPIRVKYIIDQYRLHVLNEEFADTSKNIYSPSIKRGGLEIAGFSDPTFIRRNIIAWGTSEYAYFKKLGKDETIILLKRILSPKSPIIILSSGFKEGEILQAVLQVANEYKISVALQSYWSQSTIVSNIGVYLSEHFAKRVVIHGCLCVVNNVGVGILGPSGFGKSEALLDLVIKGSTFVSDDSIIIKQVGKRFIGSSPEITKGFLEVRGIGLIDIKLTYGNKVFKESTDIELIVELVDTKFDYSLDRLGISNLKYEVLDGWIPKMQIPIRRGANVSALIETAVNTFLARKNGVDILSELNRRAGEDA
ncbi:HPr(Ser) kinase/phosphatase [Mycoplasma phocimorsus]|uniref:HPr(Ser) kinase/phosphatase n=1 Tax=Mycoplasma phocimorsus TaxID=3045839 RepID=UPI0024BF2C74|nr:HPr(Ser) kinase/phosphatase [Mycoplasma phocimorsus]MDJ1646756.1 HPr(Ser) kinase/phosphatase [Mycoplasma phocimorsus]